ncbi:ATP-binding protein [Lolliginicoccus levis]|uniref:ATP-binding protein n=1 Tax=Lolliginicoccus levis TaxID=2919542 RepID=UPI00241F1FAE|nr:ATP-binding protein [Lolliginicoccus levis]
MNDEGAALRERVLVAISGAGDTEALVQRAARAADRCGAELLVVHVLDPRERGTPPGVVEAIREQATKAAATFHTVVASDVAGALLELARSAGATRIIVGHRARPNWPLARRRGTASTVARNAGSIDVQLVATPPSRRAAHGTMRGSALSRSRTRAAWVAAIAVPTLLTAGFVPFKEQLELADVAMAFLLGTVAVALIGAWRPALTAVVLSAILLNVFYTEPFHTPYIADAHNRFTLAVMAVVAAAVATVVHRSATRAREAAHARTEAALMSSYARTILLDDNPADTLLARIREDFGLDSVELREKPARAGSPHCQEIPLDATTALVLDGPGLDEARRSMLASAGVQAVLALRHQHMMSTAAEAKRQSDAAALRTALLSALGHDLRTPLTALTMAIATLDNEALAITPEDRRELLSVADESTRQLRDLVDNLLDSSRLATGAVRPLIRSHGIDDIAVRALASVRGGNKLALALPDDLPDVLADAGLLERVIANLADNAIRHGSEPIRIEAHHTAERVLLSIIDHGPGLSPEARAQLFEPFQRHGDRDRTTGIGLGMSVAKGFATAMGGTIEASDTPGGGLTITVTLPAAPQPGLEPRA